MDPVYTTGPSQDTPYRDERQVHRNIVVYRKFFEKDPKVQFWNARGKETLWLFGRLKQGDERYFVCVKENVQKVYSALFYTEKFLLVRGCFFPSERLCIYVLAVAKDCKANRRTFWCFAETD